jgi:hypothetical protein
LYVPGAVGVKGPELAVGGGPPASGLAADVKIGAPVQVALLNRVKVTVPVGGGAGAGAPVTVAVSEIGLPIVAVGVADVVIVAVAWLMTEASFGAPQALVTLA